MLSVCWGYGGGELGDALVDFSSISTKIVEFIGSCGMEI